MKFKIDIGIENEWLVDLLDLKDDSVRCSDVKCSVDNLNDCKNCIFDRYDYKLSWLKVNNRIKEGEK